MLNDVRGWAKDTLPTYQDRKEFFESIVNGDPDPVELLRAGDEGAVRDLIAAAQRDARRARRARVDRPAQPAGSAKIATAAKCATAAAITSTWKISW